MDYKKEAEGSVAAGDDAMTQAIEAATLAEQMVYIAYAHGCYTRAAVMAGLLSRVKED